MSFTQCKDAFIQKGRALTALFPESKPWTVSDDIENLQKGADYFIVTLPSTFQSSSPDAHHKSMIWIVLFDFYVRHSTRLEATRKFEVARDQVIEHYHNDPWLLNTAGVDSVSIAAAGELLQEPGANKKPSFYVQTMTASIRQRIKLNLRVTPN